MKKTLLTLATAVLMAIGVQAAAPSAHLAPASAEKFQSVSVSSLGLSSSSFAKAPQKEAEETVPYMDYTLADEPYSAYGFNGQKARSKWAQAFELNADDATLFAGNQITHVTFYTGVRQGFNLNYIKKATVFLTYDLEAEPFATADVTLPTNPITLVKAPLAEPYTIEKGKPVYIGFQYALTNASDYAVVADGMMHNGIEGGWIAQYDTAEGKYVWDNIADQIGFLCIGAVIEGNSLPENGASVYGMEIPTAIYSGKDFGFDVVVTNKASNPITSIELTYKVGSEAPVVNTYQFQTPLPYGQLALVEVEGAKCNTNGYDIPVSAWVTKVNGVNNIFYPVPTTVYGTVFAPGTGYTRNVVMEEGTGTWCGWCPKGLYIMESLTEYAPKGAFIPVAVHGNDVMQADSFMDWLNTYASGFPCAYFNRSVDAQIALTNVGLPEFKSLFDEIHATPSAYSVELQADWANEEKTALTFVSASKFLFPTDNSNGRFKISYLITEDGVGPYEQTNNYAGGQNGAMGGWESRGSKVSTVYNDVARYTDSYAGVSGSVPTSSLWTDYALYYTHTMTIPANTISDPAKINAIAYLLDTATGEILNAAMVKAADFGIDTSAISNIGTDNSQAPVEYFNLQGIRVENPAAGNIYIRRQGTDVKKVIL